MNKISILRPSGRLQARKIQAPRAPWRWYLSNWTRWGAIKGLIAYWVIAPFARAFGIATMIGKLEAVLIRADGSMIRYGVLGYRMVTTAFVNFVVDQLIAESSIFGDFKYHDSGIGSTGEATGDTDIETTDGETRATGTQVEDDADDYQSVGTITYSTTKAIVEHGLFNASTGVTLMDRTVFSVINVVDTDSIQFTYTINIPAGS
jgi:hypothetical protein